MLRSWDCSNDIVGDAFEKLYEMQEAHHLLEDSSHGML